MVILKCGKCGKEFEVDEDRINSQSWGYGCSNCGAQAPYEIQRLAERIVKLDTAGYENWKVFRIPEKYAKAQVTLTLPLE